MLKADYLFLLYSQILIHDRTLPFMLLTLCWININSLPLKYFSKGIWLFIGYSMIIPSHLRKGNHSAIIFLYIYWDMSDKLSLIFHVFEIQKSSLNTMDRHGACMRDQTPVKSLFCCPRNCQSLFYNICSPLELGLTNQHFFTQVYVLWDWQRIGHKELKDVQTEKNRVRTVYHIVSSWWKAWSCPRNSVSSVKCRHNTKYNEEIHNFPWHMMYKPPLLETPLHKILTSASHLYLRWDNICLSLSSRTDFPLMYLWIALFFSLINLTLQDSHLH